MKKLIRLALLTAVFAGAGAGLVSCDKTIHEASAGGAQPAPSAPL